METHNSLPGAMPGLDVDMNLHRQDSLERADLGNEADQPPSQSSVSARLTQNEETVAKFLQIVQAMELRMAATIRNAEEGQQEQRLRAEKAEQEVSKLTEQLQGVSTRARGNDRPGGEVDLDVAMWLSGSHKGKGRERQSKDEEEYDAGDETDPNEEIEDIHRRHLPMNMVPSQLPRSIIGAGPTLRLGTVGTSMSTVDTPRASHLPDNSMRLSSSSETPVNSLERAVTSLTACVTKLTDHISAGQPTRMQKYAFVQSGEFKLPPQRITTPVRNERLKFVRSVMNNFFGINKDADIIFRDAPRKEDIKAFEDDKGPGPAPPYLPDWSNIKGTWNHALLLLFMEKYTELFPVEDEDHQQDICKMFMDRLSRLRKRVKQVARQPGETDIQLNWRYLVRHVRTLKEQRRNTRRNERFDTRSRITVQNATSQRGQVKVAWEHLDTILANLGAGGMSSDESDVDGEGRIVYFVKSMKWRQQALMGRMKLIDRDRNVTTTYNHIRPGNPPRTRQRRSNPTESCRNAPPGLPINFYEAGWYEKLTDRQKKEVRAAPPLQLLDIVSASN